MKQTISVIVVLMSVTITLNAQQRIPLNLDVTSTSKIPTTTIPKDKPFTITSVSCDMSSKRGYVYIVGARTPDDVTFDIDLSKVNQMPITCTATNKDDYWYYTCILHSLPSLSKLSNAYNMRSEAETRANEYISVLRNNAMILEDPYLCSYINSLLSRINPAQRLDFFKYSFKVVITKDSEMNAGIYPNGTLVLNAGMLARIHTEDELVAILCHEANHFICNHYLENMEKIQKKNLFTNIGSAVVGVAAGVFAKSASLGVATAAFSQETIDELNNLFAAIGMNFDQSQEKESDQAAVDLLPLLGYDSNAMSTCMKRIGDLLLEEGDLASYYKSGSHPKIEDRIAATGMPYERRDTVFERKMASCVSYVASVLYARGRYEQSLAMAQQNIDNGVGRGMDYYIKGECLLAVNDTEETNMEARESLLEARKTYPEGLPTLKALIISNIRLGQTEEAKKLLEEFLKLTDKEEERTWALGMIQSLAV